MPAMQAPSAFTVRVASWHNDREQLQSVRRAVFIEEQRVPETLEWDDADAVSLHVLAYDRQGQAVGTGRLLPDGHIGRMAVVRDWRGRGVGRAILEFLVQCGRRRGDRMLALNAQTHALGFYERSGFVAQGGEFMDAGIPHRQMTLRL
jgi:predicted GNAT family N-acyltransferase